MTVAEIQGTVAAYLQRSVAKFDVDGTGVNLILTAMNNARKYAERRHNWSVSRKKGYFSVTTSNKVAWDSPVWFDAGTEKMKEGKHWWLRGDATDTTNEYNTMDRPIKVITQGVKHVVETQNEYVPYADATLGWRDQRYLNEDCYFNPLLRQDHGVFRGKWLELYPRPTETKILVVDGYYWWPSWGTTSDLTRTWRFSTTDINLASGGSALFDIRTNQADGTTREAVNCIEPGGSLALLVQTSAGYANVFPTAGTVAGIVTAVNKFVRNGSVELSGSNITVIKQGVDPDLDISTFDAAGALVSSLSPTVVSTTGTTAVTSDWWTENAEEFLILQSLVEANRLGHVFTGNKEGNLPSPDKQAERALQMLIEQDLAGEQGGGQVELY